MGDDRQRCRPAVPDEGGIDEANRAATVATILAAAGGLTACEPAPTCRAVITSDTTLAADLSGCAGDGLVIGADGVTLDLGGHAIAGDAGGGGTVGIRVEGRDDVTILEGFVTGFPTGVGATDAARLAVDQLTVHAESPVFGSTG